MPKTPVGGDKQMDEKGEEDGQVPMDVMVELVARAMFQQHQSAQKLPVSETAWAVTGASWRECARAAINAMRRQP